MLQTVGQPMNHSFRNTWRQSRLCLGMEPVKKGEKEVYLRKPSAVSWGYPLQHCQGHMHVIPSLCTKVRNNSCNALQRIATAAW